MRSTVLSWRIMVVTSCLVAGCNKSPVPIVAVDPQSGELPLTVTCDGSGSYDPDGSIAGFTWDFGDGPINGGPSVSHEFTTDGSHQITLTVVDNKGKSAGSRVTVVVTRPTFAALRLTRIEGQLGPQNATQVYRADLSGVSTGLIASIIIYDNETGETGRMSGSYSGAAIDAVKISSLLCDQAAAVRSAPDTVPLAYTPDATAFAPGCQNEPTEFALYGTDATGFYLDNSQATLGAFDGMLKDRGTEQWRFDFSGRNRRPPVDPVNAMLSYAYSLLVKDITVTLGAVGFDPYLGFYHALRYGRPSLALDLMEEFRPIIADSVVLWTANNRVLGQDDFITRGRSVSLTPNARKKFIHAYERRLDALVTHPIFGYRISYRRVLEVQARLLGRYLMGEIDAYPSFRTR